MKIILALFSALALAASPLPTAKLIPITPNSWPFGAASHERVPEDLNAIGYVEEEYLLTGIANVYDWTAPGPAVVRTANAPYTTRVLVRRPASRTRFSGTVAVEMANPSNLYDLNLGWTINHAEFARNGDAWVMITAKPVSVVTLQTFNPTRYTALNWANPLGTGDPANCQRVAADSARSTENGLVWDMFTQTGAWLRSPSPSNPLAYGETNPQSLPVQRLIAWGYSQTGSFLYTYVNAIHPLDIKTNGKPMFDAYLIAMASGPSAINQCAGPIPQGDPRRMIHNAGVPVIRVMSQSDYLTSINARRPDSDTPGDLYRNYEIAGAAHATPDELNFGPAPDDIEKGGRAVPPMSCNEGPRSRFPNWVAFNAIFHNLDEWVRKGTAPPRDGDIIVIDGKPPLDVNGNVKGGIRSPFVDVPTSTWFGNSTGESFCRIAGHEKLFDPAQLRGIYINHAAYVSRVTADVNRLVKERWIEPADGDTLIEQAKTAEIP